MDSCVVLLCDYNRQTSEERVIECAITTGEFPKRRLPEVVDLASRIYWNDGSSITHSFMHTCYPDGM